MNCLEKNLCLKTKKTYKNNEKKKKMKMKISLTNIFSFILIFRIINSFCIKTMFVPDEYWQSLEVAHKMVFGYGYLSWEWTRDHIRSYIHPSIFAIYFYLLKIMGLDSSYMVVNNPFF